MIMTVTRRNRIFKSKLEKKNYDRTNVFTSQALMQRSFM